MAEKAVCIIHRVIVSRRLFRDIKGKTMCKLQHSYQHPYNPFVTLFPKVHRPKARPVFPCTATQFVLYNPHNHGERGYMKTKEELMAEYTLLSEKETRKMIGVGHTYFYEKIVNRNLLRRVKHSKGCVRYRLSDIIRYIESVTQEGHEPYGY